TRTPKPTETPRLQGQEARAPAPAARLRLLVIGEDILTTYPLPDSGEVVIGRSAKSGVRIDHPSISRNHAVLHIGDRFTIRDLESKNGTRVRQKALATGQTAEVALEEMFGVGSLTLAVQRVAATAQLRRLWSHGDFEGHLEAECSRADHREASFAVLRLNVAESAKEGTVEEILAATSRAADIVASYGPSEYEILLPDVSAVEAEEAARRIGGKLAAEGVTARAGLAV